MYSDVKGLQIDDESGPLSARENKWNWKIFTFCYGSRFHLNNLMDDCYYTELLMFIILAILAKPMQKLRQMIFGYLQNLKSFVSG